MRGYALLFPFTTIFININGNLTNRALRKAIEFITEYKMIPMEFNTIPNIASAVKATYKHNYNSCKTISIMTDSETFEYSYQDWCESRIVLVSI